MEPRLIYGNERFTHNGRKCTVVNATNRYLPEQGYITVFADVQYDDDRTTAAGVQPSELVDNLKFLNNKKSFWHSTACRIYGISKEEFMHHISNINNWEDIFVNGQEEFDGVSFEVHSMYPQAVVDLFRDIPKAFVFAWYHAEHLDLFAASSAESLSVSFPNGIADGIVEGWLSADIRISTDDGKSFEFGTGDFMPEDIEYFEKLDKNFQLEKE